MKIIETMSGFVSTEIAWACICCILATLLCMIHSLIMWNRGKDITSVRSSKRVWRGRKMTRPRTRGRITG